LGSHASLYRSQPQRVLPRVSSRPSPSRQSLTSFLALPTPLLLSCPIRLIQSAHDGCLLQKGPSRTLRLILVEIPVALFVCLDDGDPDLVARDRAEVSTYDESNPSASRSGADEGVLFLIHDPFMTQANAHDLVGGYPGLRGIVVPGLPTLSIRPQRSLCVESGRSLEPEPDAGRGPTALGGPFCHG
jgi:hypothetical protein